MEQRRKLSAAQEVLAVMDKVVQDAEDAQLEAEPEAELMKGT